MVEDDPQTIPSEGNSTNCGISVSFESGTNYEGRPELPNGSSTILYQGQNLFGLGFTVKGWVTEGGIGNIGENQNPENRAGTWTIDQWTSAWTTQNGHFAVVDGRVQNGGPPWRDIKLGVPHKASGNSFSWYDHPSATGWGIYRNQAFSVSVSRGNEVCHVEFHFVQRNLGPGYTLHWGKGATGVWPR